MTGRQKQNMRTALLFLLPNLVGFLLFTAGPVLFSLGSSFTNWNLQRTLPLRFTGLTNYMEMLGDEQFHMYLANTMYLMLGLPFALVGSLLLAILLDRKIRGLVVYRTVFYLPTITSGIALMILWKAILNPDFGPLNNLLSWVLNTAGLNNLLASLGTGPLAPPQWLVSTRNVLGLAVEQVRFTPKQLGLGARDAMILMGVWTAIGGANMLLYLAALSNVPQHLYDAASIDGAGKVATFRYVTWPQLAPTTFFIVVMSVIGGLQGGFEQARVMTQGGPGGTTTTLAYYIYQKAFLEYELGFASAVSWVLFIFIFALTALYWKAGNREVND